MGVRLHAVRRGTGPTVVLVHGWACSSAVWALVTERLEGAYETVAFDLPGFGASETIEGSFSLADVATSLEEALESFGIVDAVVVGHSMGGMVVQHLYAQSPERVAGLVLCGTTSAAGAPYQEANLQLKGLIRSAGPGERWPQPWDPASSVISTGRRTRPRSKSSWRKSRGAMRPR